MQQKFFIVLHYYFIVLYTHVCSACTHVCSVYTHVCSAQYVQLYVCICIYILKTLKLAFIY